jgi:hypothetical protein
MTYYIYHIEGVKIGCTKNVKTRMSRQKNPNYTILETHDDINTAANREKELNIQYGYKWNDGQDYRAITKITGRSKDTITELYGKPVIAINIETNQRKEYSSWKGCSNELGLNQHCVWRVLKGYRKSHKGYTFNYKS